jgi:hypothetical protein
MQHLPSWLRAIQIWRTHCILNSGSCFTSESLWTLGNLDQLEHHLNGASFINRKLEHSDIEGQFTGLRPQVVKLAAERLFPHGQFLDVERKRKLILAIWELSGASRPQSQLLNDDVLFGVGMPAPDFWSNFFSEVHFSVRAHQALKRMDWSTRARIVTSEDPSRFTALLSTIERRGAYSAPYILDYLWIQARGGSSVTHMDLRD